MKNTFKLAPKNTFESYLPIKYSKSKIFNPNTQPTYLRALCKNCHQPLLQHTGYPKEICPEVEILIIR